MVSILLIEQEHVDGDLLSGRLQAELFVEVGGGLQVLRFVRGSLVRVLPHL